MRPGLRHSPLILALLVSLGCVTPGLKEGALAGGAAGAAVGGAGNGSNRGTGALVGLLVGAGVGAVIGIWLADPESRGPDSDGDGVADAQDNCPKLRNRDQQDSNGDGVGDVCTPDEGRPNP